MRAECDGLRQQLSVEAAKHRQLQAEHATAMRAAADNAMRLTEQCDLATRKLEAMCGLRLNGERWLTLASSV